MTDEAHVDPPVISDRPPVDVDLLRQILEELQALRVESKSRPSTVANADRRASLRLPMAAVVGREDFPPAEVYAFAAKVGPAGELLREARAA